MNEKKYSHTTELIAQAVYGENPPLEVVEQLEYGMGICAVTGKTEEYTVPRNKLLGSSFNDLDLLMAPDSNRVGIKAYLALKYKWQRMSSWICWPENFIRLRIPDVRKYLLIDPYRWNYPWAAYITTSYKKHGSLRAPLNHHPGEFRILFETEVIDFMAYENYSSWYDQMLKMRFLGFNKKTLQELVFPVGSKYRKFMSEWMRYEDWAWDKKRTPMYRFLAHILPNNEELEVMKSEDMSQRGM